MSRIDEALRQAGLKSAGDRAVEQPMALDSFPSGSDEPAEVEPPPVPAPSSPARGVAPIRPRSVPVRSEPAADASAPRFTPVEKLVIHDHTGHACVEQYRRVAAMLHQLQEERGTKVIMVASAQMSEGKTLTAANLALTLSESYQRRVLLVDADMRRPSLTALFNIQTISGLSESLRTANRGPLRIIELSDRLALLPGGKPDQDPMAGLTSGRMQQILEEAAVNYDWVILDTPPVALQPDAHLISSMVEATVFVIGAGISQSAAVQSAIETIGRDKIVGVILNRVDAGAFSESAYYDYYYEQRPVARSNDRLARVAVGT
jgi:protein-tyrosine kinase